MQIQQVQLMQYNFQWSQENFNQNVPVIALSWYILKDYVVNKIPIRVEYLAKRFNVGGHNNYMLIS